MHFYTLRPYLATLSTWRGFSLFLRYAALFTVIGVWLFNLGQLTVIGLSIPAELPKVLLEAITNFYTTGGSWLPVALTLNAVILAAHYAVTIGMGANIHSKLLRRLYLTTGLMAGLYVVASLLTVPTGLSGHTDYQQVARFALVLCGSVLALYSGRGVGKTVYAVPTRDKGKIDET